MNLFYLTVTTVCHIFADHRIIIFCIESNLLIFNNIIHLFSMTVILYLLRIYLLRMTSNNIKVIRGKYIEYFFFKFL